MPLALTSKVNKDAKLAFKKGTFSPLEGGYLRQLMQHAYGINKDTTYRSIATPFAYPLEYFILSSKDANEDETARKAKDTWSDLAAYFALSSLRKKQTTLIPVNLPEVYDASRRAASILADETVKPDDEKRDGGTLQTLLGAKWNNIHIILEAPPSETGGVDSDRVMGMTSPYTIFCPSPEFIPMEDSPDKYTPIEKLCILKWLTRLERNMSDNLGRSISDLIDYAKKRFSSGVATDNEWDGYNFKEGVWEIDHQNTLNKMDFTITKGEVLDDWKTLFAAIALNDSKELGIKCIDGVFFIDSTPVSTLTDENELKPLVSCAELIAAVNIDMLDVVDKKHIRYWLARYIEKYENNLENRSVVCANNYLKELSGGMTIDHKTLELHDNRFYDIADECYKHAFTVHRYNMELLDPDDDNYVQKRWVDTLYLLAFKDIKGL